MRSFRNHVTEAKETIVFTFGRFNPPTIGHEKLIEKVASVAGSNPYRVYPSHSQNPKKDPLPHALKVAYMRKMFPKHRKNIIADKKMKTAIFIAEALYNEGFKNLVMVVGSDRVQEFQTLLNRYNDAPDKKGNQLFKFDSVKVVSAGERDPDAEGVEGMSASKMRAAATDGDKDAFLTGLPKGFKDGEKLYRDIRKNMGIREEREMGDMTDFETVRDMYLTGKIWNAGDIVEAKGFTGEVVRKGTNYLSFVDEDGKVHKVWLHEIRLTTPRVRPGGGAEGKSIDQSVKIHVKLMKQYMDKGMDKDKASKKAMSDVMNMKPAERKKFLAKKESRIIIGDKTKIDEDFGDSLPWLKKLKDKVFDKTHKKGLDSLSYEYAKRAAKEYKKNKRMNPIHIVHDLAKMYSNVSDRVLRDHINDLVNKGLIPQELKAEFDPVNESMSFKDFVSQINVNEKLGKNSTAGDYVKDFKKSDAPQFKGKSKKKRHTMAIAAYLDNKDEGVNEWGEVEEAAEYQGRKVKLNKPFYTPDGPKKSAVYVKNENGEVIIVRFGDPNMEIKADNPERRKSFRARHNCDNSGPKTKARYWSCKAW